MLPSLETIYADFHSKLHNFIVRLFPSFPFFAFLIRAAKFIRGRLAAQNNIDSAAGDIGCQSNRTLLAGIGNYFCLFQMIFGI